MYKSIRLFGLVTFLFLVALLFCTKTGDTQGQGTKISANSLQAEDPIAPPDTNRAPEKWALLVGIDKYQHSKMNTRFSDLAGCVNDIMDMEKLLIGKFGFKKENIKMLTNEQATHAAIVQAVQTHLIGNAQQNDIVVFHFSGHGSQMEDNSGDEPDKFDETIIPYDTRDPGRKVFDISDDEINGLLSQLNAKTKNVTFIFDACNSGTATRAAGRIRYIPPDDREPRKEQPAYALTTRGAAEGKNDMRREDLDYVLISACLEKESAYEHFAEGKEHGALTYFLVRELEKAGSGVTYRDVMDNVGDNINQRYRNQNPQLEGTKRNNYVFSDSTSIAQTYILASPRGNNKVRLEAGMVHGMTEGSIFEIYGKDISKFEPPAQPIAKVELVRVENFASEGKIIGTGSIEPNSRAVEREHNYPDLKIRTHFLNSDASPTLQGIKDGLSSFKFIELVNEPLNYDLLLREKGTSIVIEGPDTTELSTPVLISEPNIQSRVIEDVQKWAKWFNVLAIENRNTALTFEISLNQLGKEASAEEGIDRILTVKDGESVGCQLNNKSDKKLYFVILDLSSDGSITPIYPSEGASELISAKSSCNKEIETYVPGNMLKVKDVLKVLATSKSINVDIFTQQPIKRGEEQVSRGLRDENNPLEQFFSNAARGTTRGGRVINAGDWTTAQAAFVVKR